MAASNEGLALTSFRLHATPFMKTARDQIVLTDRQRSDLMKLGTCVKVAARTVIYEQGSAAQSVYVIVDGVVKSYRKPANGKRTVEAFLFARDLFGLAENGCYVNSTQAITRTTMYRLPIHDLVALLKCDGDLQFKFLLKVTYELREAQRRAFLIHRRDAVGRLAMFIAMMAARYGRGAPRLSAVTLPMSRSDIADFVGLSVESVSRAIAGLKRRGLIAFDGRDDVRILNPSGFVRLLNAT